jgi:hypothetical protein
MFDVISVGTGTVRALAARLLRSWHSDEYARAVAAELDAHIALHTADKIRQGLSPIDARRDALLQLGGTLQARERCVEAMTFRWIVRRVHR